MLKIRRNALESALAAAKSTYPDEFIGLFREDGKGVLSELILAPLSEYNENSSSYQPLFLPTDLKTNATFHSHPSYSAGPSSADLRLFSRAGKWHFISCLPYTEESTKAYEANGKEAEFEVV